MSKTPQVEPQTSSAAPEAPELSLTEFCARLSATVRRPELLAGFEFSERTAGRVKDKPEAFQARFDKFCNKPV